MNSNSLQNIQRRCLPAKKCVWPKTTAWSISALWGGQCTGSWTENGLWAFWSPLEWSWTNHFSSPHTLSGIPSVKTANSLRHRLLLYDVHTVLSSDILILAGLSFHTWYKQILLDVIVLLTVVLMYFGFFFFWKFGWGFSDMPGKTRVTLDLSVLRWYKGIKLNTLSLSSWNRDSMS